MTVFVTGGSGFVGRRLIGTLVAKGDTVLALARSAEAQAIVAAAGATPVHGDLFDRDALIAGMRGCDAVFHSAALMAFYGHRREMQRVNIDGTRMILDAAQAAGVPRLVLISAAAVISDGRPVVQADECRPYPRRIFGDYCRTKAAAERVVLAASRPGFGTVAVRPPLIWGAGDVHFLPEVVARVKRRRFVWIDRGNYAYATCHVRNVCEGAILAAQNGRGGCAYFLTDKGPPVTFRQFLNQLLATQGLKAGSLSLPRRLAWHMAEIVERMPFAKEPPMTRAHLALVGGEVTVSDGRARRALGYVGRVSRADGMAELAAMRNGRYLPGS